MASHVALLRAINVGGTGKLPMAQLRAVVEGLGHHDVQTYVQSGNVVFTAGDPGTPTADLEAQLSTAIQEAAGFAPPVLVLDVAELEALVEANPYAAEAAEVPKHVHALVLPSAPGAAGDEELRSALQRAAAKGSQDRATLVGRAYYLHTPDGIGRSALAAALTSPKSSAASKGTARNWATVTKLLGLARG